VLALFHQDARHIGRDAEAEIDAAIGLQLLRDATGDDLLDVELGTPNVSSGRKISPDMAGS
jgi:hypothetical protein